MPYSSSQFLLRRVRPVHGGSGECADRPGALRVALAGEVAPGRRLTDVLDRELRHDRVIHEEHQPTDRLSFSSRINPRSEATAPAGTRIRAVRLQGHRRQPVGPCLRTEIRGGRLQRICPGAFFDLFPDLFRQIKTLAIVRMARSIANGASRGNTC